MTTDGRQQLLIFPCNGNGIEAIDCLGDVFQMVGFIDDTLEKQGTRVLGYPVYGRDILNQMSEAQVLAVPGSPKSFLKREKTIDSLGLSSDRFATVIHPAARVSRAVSLGRNILVMAGVVITSNAAIGDHVCILPNSVIHHDAVIGDWSLVGSNVTVAGHTEIGRNCYIGSGTSIMNGLRIGDGALVGLGSNVIRSVLPSARVAGNPARPI